MSGQRKRHCSHNDSDTPIFALKREYDGKFSGMCDDVIEMIMCDLELVDLANISDTSTRLRGIAATVFARKYGHRLISLETFHYTDYLNNGIRQLYAKGSPIKHEPMMVRIFDTKIWFKLLRNFGASIKQLRIQGSNLTNETKTESAVQNVSKYVSEFCSDSLENLENIHGFLGLTRPLTKLQEFCCFGHCINNSDVLELMPNVRSLRFGLVSKTMVKHCAKLERVVSVLNSNEQVQIFISFLQLNQQIKYLRLHMTYQCGPEDTVSIYSSIADNLSQLKTLKLFFVNKPLVDHEFRFKSIESFSTVYAPLWFTFQFNDLRKLTLKGHGASSPFIMNFVLQNQKLKILKIHNLSETLLNGMQQVLNELPELELIIVAVYMRTEERYSILKSILGTEWEEFEKTGRRKLSPSMYRRFRKIKSTN